VFAPLNKTSAHAFIGGAAKSELMAPFYEMPFPINILIVGAAPNQYHRFCTNWTHRPVYQSHCGGNFAVIAGVGGPWGEKKWKGGRSFINGGRYFAGWSAPIDPYGHFFGRRVAAVFPSGLNGEARNV